MAVPRERAQGRRPIKQLRCHGTRKNLLRAFLRGGPARICTLEGISQQIYSLPRLTASVPTHEYAKKNAREV